MCLILCPLVALISSRAGVLAAGPAQLKQEVHVPNLDGEWHTRLDQAERLVSSGEFRTAIEVMQKAVDYADDRLYRLPPTLPAKGVHGNFVPTTYISVAEKARRMIAAMPHEGRELYVELFQEVAAGVLREALASGDVKLLRRAALNYFPTPASIQAGQALGDRYIEDGRVRRALKVWQNMLRAGFDNREFEYSMRLRVLMAMRTLGEREIYADERKLFVERVRNQGGSDGLPEEGVGQLLRPLEELESSVPTSASAEVSVVALAGQRAVHGVDHRLPSVAPAPMTYDRVWSVPWLLREEPHHKRALIRHHRLHQCFYPGIDADTAYISGVFKRWRVDRVTGLLRDDADLKRVAREALEFRETSESPLYLPVVHGDRLFTRTISFLREHTQYMRYTIEEELPWRALVVQDKHTGRVLWSTRRFNVGMIDDPERVSVVTPPVIVGDRAIVGGWSNAGYVNVVVAAFNLETGKKLWDTLLVSNQVELTMFGEPAREPMSWVMIEDEGLVYCVTNLGAVAAVDALDGHIEWLTTYESLPVSPTLGKRPEKRRLLWDTNPPLLRDGVLLATPRDSRYLYAFDTGLRARPTREIDASARPILWRWRNLQQKKLSHLLGYRKGRLYLSGKGWIQGLACNPLSEPPREDISKSFEHSWLTIRGRPAMVEQGIVFTDNNHIQLIDYQLENMRPLIHKTFRDISRNQFRCAGNVSVDRGQIFVMSREALTAFTAVPPPEPEDAASSDPTNASENVPNDGPPGAPVPRSDRR